MGHLMKKFRQKRRIGSRGKGSKKHSGRKYFSDGICRVFPDGKVCYPKLNQAEWERAQIAANYPDDEFNVFKCDYCGHWHIGRTS